MITKSAADKNNCALNISFFRSARSAWGHLLRSLSRTRPQKVLLPAYIGFTEREGSGVFDPVSECRSEHAFYRIRDDLSVDLDDFRKQLQDGVDVALVIHYFGFCRSEMDEIKRLCLEANVVLVEDCAHAFYLESSCSPLGGIGDFSFYSLHKYIATDSGGILRINNSKWPMDPIPDFDRAVPEVLEQYARTDFDAVKDVRRRNYALYDSALAPLSGIQRLFALTEHDIPQTFPIRVKNSRREALYFYLMERNIPTVALYYRLIDEIDAAKYPTSTALSREILNLPVHQDTTAEDVRSVCQGISDFFAKN